LITGTGWTLRELESTPWPDCLELMSYWKHHPPVHVLVRGFFEIEDDEPGNIPTEDELEAGIRDFQ